MTIDLWPEDIGILPGDRLPIDVMREQAKILGERTAGVVQAEVRTAQWDLSSWLRSSPSRSRFGRDLAGAYESLLRIEFVLRAPKLAGYEYLLFFIIQPPGVYPSEIVLDDDRLIEVTSLEHFENLLRTIFTAERTRKIIGGLLAQSRSA